MGEDSLLQYGVVGNAYTYNHDGLEQLWKKVVVVSCSERHQVTEISMSSTRSVDDIRCSQSKPGPRLQTICL